MNIQMSKESEAKKEWSGRIFFLELYQSVMNDTDGERGISVTLNVQGCIVSGIMIGMKPYYDAISKIMVETGEGKPGEDTSDAKEELKEMFKDIIKGAKIAFEKGQPINQIFLKDAVIQTGDRPITFKGGYWTGRIDDVNGFMFGALSSYSNNG